MASFSRLISEQENFERIFQNYENAKDKSYVLFSVSNSNFLMKLKEHNESMINSLINIDCNKYDILPLIKGFIKNNIYLLQFDEDDNSFIEVNDGYDKDHLSVFIECLNKNKMYPDNTVDFLNKLLFKVWYGCHQSELNKSKAIYGIYAFIKVIINYINTNYNENNEKILKDIYKFKINDILMWNSHASMNILATDDVNELNSFLLFLKKINVYEEYIEELKTEFANNEDIVKLLGIRSLHLIKNMTQLNDNYSNLKKFIARLVNNAGFTLIANEIYGSELFEKKDIDCQVRILNNVLGNDKYVYILFDEKNGNATYSRNNNFFKDISYNNHLGMLKMDLTRGTTESLKINNNEEAMIKN